MPSAAEQTSAISQRHKSAASPTPPMAAQRDALGTCHPPNYVTSLIPPSANVAPAVCVAGSSSCVQDHPQDVKACVAQMVTVIRSPSL